MAKMIPEEISPITRSDAERKMFPIIKSGLPNNWIVMHSLAMADHSTKPWAEIDFVIIGPYGVMCLEVKGGRISIENGMWVFTDRYGNRSVKNEGPFEQANSAQFALMKYLESSIKVDDILFGFGVVTPDITFDVKNPQVVDEILYDDRDLEQDFIKYIERSFGYWQKKFSKKPDLKDSVKSAIVNELRGDIETAPSLSLKMNQSQEEIIRLTEEQKVIMKGMAGNNRVIVKGGAGTGKTICAVEEARRLVADGKKVLFCCFNRRLAYSLQKEIGDWKGLTVANIHRLMRDIILEADIPLPGEGDYSLKNDYPEYCAAAIKALGRAGSYHALIIDEGQDLLHLPYLTDVFDPLLIGGIDKGYWRVFMDPQQNIFMQDNQDALALIQEAQNPEYILNINCRNTKPIADTTAIISGTTFTETLNVPGPMVENIFYSDKNDAKRKILRHINKLLSEGIDPNRISVLSPRLLENSVLSGGFSEPTSVTLVDPGTDEDLGAKDVGYYTIQSFKGLESDVVLLVDLEDFVETSSLALNYVGGSRAKLLLATFAAESKKTDYENLVRDAAIKLIQQSGSAQSA